MAPSLNDLRRVFYGANPDGSVSDAEYETLLEFQAAGVSALDLLGMVGPGGALTQTYATADPTLSTPVAVTVATTGATNVTPFGYTTAAQANAIVTNFNNLLNEVEDLRRFVNSLVDILQDKGIVS